MKDKTSKRMPLNGLLFLLLIFLTFYILFKDQSLIEIFKVITSVNIFYILLGFLFMSLYFCFQAFNEKRIMHLFKIKVPFLKMVKYVLIENFFSAITPATAGGQPMAVYYMAKEGISASQSTLVMIIQVCCFQICNVFVSILCAILNPNILHGDLRFLFYLGILLNTLVLVGTLFCLFSKTIPRKIVNFFIDLISKLGFKSIENKKENIEKELVKYNKSAQFIKKEKGEFALSIFRVLLQLICYHLIPFTIYKAFGLSGLSILQLFTMQAVLYGIVSFIPLPGAVGISEAVFLSIFTPAFGGNLIRSALLLNRGINFYFFVIISFVVVIINIFRLKKKNNK